MEEKPKHTVGGEVERAFKTMVRRWLVKVHGEWRLRTPSPERKRSDKAKAGRQVSSKRAHAESCSLDDSSIKCTGNGTRGWSLYQDGFYRTKKVNILESSKLLKTSHSMQTHEKTDDSWKKYPSQSTAHASSQAAEKRKYGQGTHASSSSGALKRLKLGTTNVAEEIPTGTLILNNAAPTKVSRHTGTGPAKVKVAKSKNPHKFGQKQQGRTLNPGSVANADIFRRNGDADRSKKLSTKVALKTTHLKQESCAAATANLCNVRIRIERISDGTFTLWKNEDCNQTARFRGFRLAHEARNKAQDDCKSSTRARRSDGENKPVKISATTSVGAKDEKRRGYSSKPVYQRTSNDESDEEQEGTEFAVKMEHDIPVKPARPQLRAATSWGSSDLPKLFRSASNSRKPEDCKAAVKREQPQHTASRKTLQTKAVKMEDTKPKKNDIAGQEQQAGSMKTLVCSVRGCILPVSSDRFCESHNKRARCAEEGCSDLVSHKSTRCYCHKTRKKCRESGCTKFARVRGVCLMHGGRPICRREGCDRTVYVRGLCSMHLDGSRNSDKSKRGGNCLAQLHE